MKRVFVRDEIVTGVNDVCAPKYRAARDSGYRAIPAGGSQTGGQKQRKTAAAHLEKVCRDAQIAAKLDRAAELIERITAMRSRPIPDAADAGPNAWELMAGYQPSAGEMARGASAAELARICAESEAAYAARNPHKRETAV